MRRTTIPRMPGAGRWVIAAAMLWAVACGERPASEHGASSGGDAASPLELVAPDRADRSAWRGQPEADTLNVVLIVHRGWENATFELHLFENPRATQQGEPPDDVPPDPRLDLKRFHWRREGRALSFRYDGGGDWPLELTGRVETRGRQVICSGRVVNRSDQRWSRWTGLGWMGLWARGAPEFHDPEGERTFAYRSGSTTPVPIAELKGRRRPNYVILLIEKLYRPQLSVENAARTRRITIQSEPCNSLAGCRAPSIASINANLDLNLPPQGSTDFVTAITFEDIAPAEMP